MDDRDFQILKLRLTDRKTYQEIGQTFDLSPQRVKQLVAQGLKKLFYDRELEKWKAGAGLGSVSEDLLALVYLLGPEMHAKIRRLIKNWNIKELKDFRRHDLNHIRIKDIGQITGLKIKIALLKMRVPYDMEDMEALETKLERISRQDDQGLRLRFAILSRDNFTCQYCGRSPRKDPAVILNLDHIVPFERGGIHEEKNLITSCRECNIGKGERLIRAQMLK